jgi:hypothetical protein
MFELLVIEVCCTNAISVTVDSKGRSLLKSLELLAIVYDNANHPYYQIDIPKNVSL